MMVNTTGCVEEVAQEERAIDSKRGHRSLSPPSPIGCKGEEKDTESGETPRRDPIPHLEENTRGGGF